MTFKERLSLEHLNRVDNKYVGGCAGCPKTYGYEAQLECNFESPNACRECWNREIPESEFTTADDYICVVKNAVNEWFSYHNPSDKIKSIDSMIIVLQEARMRLEDKHEQETV